MTTFSRRNVLTFAGAAAAAAMTVPQVTEQDAYAQGFASGSAESGWEEFRALFALSDDTIHMSAMLLASHPKPVRDAIEEHRRGLDANPVVYLENNNNRLTEAARSAGAGYLGVHTSRIALTDSTTMGVGLVYNGLKLKSGQEVLTTREDYFVTHESLRLASERTGASVRSIELFERIEDATEDEIVSRIIDEVGPSTRAVALTWVHSSTGLKIPVRAISAALQDLNAQRDEDDQVLLGVDGVHGFGIENVSFEDLGCDFLMAGCHKWLFGPRGTGIVAISERGLAAVRPTIPSFMDDGVFSAWLQDENQPPGSNDGERMSPGGFKPFEHRWALPQAFELHRSIGRDRIAGRTHELASALKQALSEMPGVVVITPSSPNISSGIVAFDVEGLRPQDVVARLRDRGIVASVAPYATQHVRLTPSIRNSEAEIEKAAAALHEIAGS